MLCCNSLLELDKSEYHKWQSWMCSTASRAECTCNLWLTDINECTENTDGCKEGSFLTQYCTDDIPEAEGERLFNCSCPAGFEVFTAAGQNGFGTVVQYGEDVDENPGDVRVIDKSCIRTYGDFPVRLLLDDSQNVLF